MASTGIGFYSGMQLLINNTVGPALVLIPSLFQQFGYLSVIFILCVVSILSVLSALMLCLVLNHYVTYKKAHRSYSELDEEQEESGITLYHVMQQYIKNKLILKLILIIYIIALILRLMAAIIQSGQILDYLIRDTFYKTCALGISKQNMSILCSSLPFEPEFYVFSFGFIVLLIICIILFKTVNFDNIDGSIILQWFANVTVVVLLFIWLHIFWNETSFESNRISFFYSNWNNQQYHLSHVVSVICANYAFIIPIPSWYTQKSKNIDNRLIIKTFVYSILFVFILFVLIGIFGAFAYEPQLFEKYNNNLFTILNESESAGIMGKISVYAFPIAQNITTIPVLCIIIAFNIKNFGIDYRNSLIISSVSPWIASLLFFNGDGFNSIVDWTSIFITIINFVLPPIMYIKMKNITQNQSLDSSLTKDSEEFLMDSHQNDVESDTLIQEIDSIDNKGYVLRMLRENPFKISYGMIITTSLLCAIIIYDKVFV